MKAAAAVLIALVACAQCAAANRLFLSREEFQAEQRGAASGNHGRALNWMGSYGVYGQWANSGYGVYGQSVPVAYGVYGGLRRLSSWNTRNTRDLLMSMPSYGVYGQWAGSGSYGVYGQWANSGSYGVYGMRRLSSWNQGRDLRWAMPSYGVYGQWATPSYGVYGQWAGSYGVYGM